MPGGDAASPGLLRTESIGEAAAASAPSAAKDFAKMAVARELPPRARLVRREEKTNREKTNMATVASGRHKIRSPQKSAAAD
jgi:hypothetical protein